MSQAFKFKPKLSKPFLIHPSAVKVILFHFLSILIKSRQLWLHLRDKNNILVSLTTNDFIIGHILYHTCTHTDSWAPFMVV